MSEVLRSTVDALEMQGRANRWDSLARLSENWAHPTIGLCDPAEAIRCRAKASYFQSLADKLSREV